MTLQIPTYYGNLLKDKENPGREQHCQPKLGGKKKNKQKTQQQQQKKPKTTKASTENWFKCIKEFSINSSPATCNYLRPFNPQHQEILLD